MSDHSMMIRADARSMGAVTSTTTRVSDRWKSTSNHAASECISYYNTDKSDARLFRAARTTRTPATPAVRETKHNAAADYNSLLNMVGALGDN